MNHIFFFFLRLPLMYNRIWTCVWKTGERIRKGKSIREQWRFEGTKEERIVESWESVVSVEVSRNWTWLCAYKQQPAHPKTNYKMLKDHSMKLVSLTLFHPLYSLSLWLKLSISFSSFTRVFSRFCQKNKSRAFLYSAIVPLHESILEDPVSFFLSSGRSKRGGWALTVGRKRRWRGVKKVV